MQPRSRRRSDDPGRRVGYVLVTVGVLGMAAIGFAIARQTGSTDEPKRVDVSSKRDARFRFCKAELPSPPAGLRLAKRELRNLGGNMMGESVSYKAFDRSVRVHIGYDALDAADDLDLVDQGTVTVDGRDFKLLQSGPLPRIWAANSVDSGLIPPCNELTVFATGFDRSEVVALTGELRVTGP